MRNLMPSASKQTRLNIRASEQDKDLIERAANALEMSVSEFVLQRAVAEAQAILADRTQFRLSPRQWREFCQALDAPPRPLPELQKLLNTPGVFDG
jgi:uncharacterized protein (DUF1778 family)